MKLELDGSNVRFRPIADIRFLNHIATVKTQLALMLVLLTSCRSEATNVVPGKTCKVVTFALSDVYDRAAKLMIDGRPVGIWIEPPDMPGMSSGEIKQRICGRVPVRFRSGTLDVVATVDASTDVNVVYITPSEDPVIQITNHSVPLLD